MIEIKAKPGCCEEASLFGPPGLYTPCNEPATKMIGWTVRKEGPYRMCDMCADHNIKNRGAEDLTPLPHQQKPVPDGKINFPAGAGKTIPGDKQS